MVHPDVFHKHVVSPDAKGVVVEEVDVGNQFKIEKEFEFHDHMLQLIFTKAAKSRFIVVIGRSNNDLENRYICDNDMQKQWEM